MTQEKKPRIDVMLDMETCGLREDAALLSMSMIAFRPGEEEERGVFDVAIDLTSCFMAGMQFDDDTQAWWMRQDAQARAGQVCRTDRVSIQKAMCDAHAWLTALTETYNVVMWCRGADFDFPKLEYGFRRFVEKPAPYPYWNKRDVRTFVRELGIDDRSMERKGVKHSSLDDCRHQITQLKAAARRLVHMMALESAEQEQ